MDHSPTDPFADRVRADLAALPGLKSGEALNRLALIVDAAHEARRTDLAESIDDAAQPLSARNLPPDGRAFLFYCLGNAWNDVAALRNQTGEAWRWEQPDSQKALTYFRRALDVEGMPAFRRCEILTNMGNLYSAVGRFVDAVRCWSRALELDPEFLMASGNLGHGLAEYARCLYDEGQTHFMMHRALEVLRTINAKGVYADHAPTFAKIAARIERRLTQTCGWPGDECRWSALREHDHSLGGTDEEIAYRKWCLEHRLFLNPLNDLGSLSLAAHDPLGPPSMTVQREDGPKYQGFFNAMKQEFASARYLLFAGETGPGRHFSDLGVALVETFDSRVYGFRREQVRLAFRSLFSIFDKIAVFLNDYFDLRRGERSVSFKNIWIDPKDQKAHALHPKLDNRENWPLRGLYWISKDFHEGDKEFVAAIEPDAQRLADLRHRLEHRYVAIHVDGHERGPLPFGLDADPMALPLSDSEFSRKARRLAQLARTALIHLSLAVHHEEQVRHRALPERMRAHPVPGGIVEDQRKR